MNPAWIRQRKWTAALVAVPGALALGALALDFDSAELANEASEALTDVSSALQDALELPVMHAAGPGGPDSDGDGLTDLFEDILGTGTQRADSDGDGYWDAEEFARQSDPLDASDIPVLAPASCGMGIYETGNSLRPVVALYVADGDLRGAELGMGARVGNQLRGLPLSFFSKNATISQSPTAVSQSVVYIFDGTLNPKHVHRLNDLSVYATVDYRSSIISADAVNLASIDGVVVEHILTAFHSAKPNPSLVFGQGSSGVYKPLGGPSGTPPPPTWVSGKVCAQGMIVGGVNGPVVYQEVVSADCEDGWASYCGSDCTSSVGSTVQMLDPLALIGG